MNRFTNKVVVTDGSSGVGLAVAREAMDSLINLVIRLGILKEDLDYHLIRASMVIIFLFFGYQKWFAYEAQVLIPYISNGPLIFWMYGFRYTRRQLVFGLFGMVVWHALVPRILEQKIRNSWRPRFNCYLHYDCNDHPIHAEWLGCVGGWVSSNDRQRSFPNEGCGPFCCISLFAETRCIKSCKSAFILSVSSTTPFLWRGSVSRRAGSLTR